MRSGENRATSRCWYRCARVGAARQAGFFIPFFAFAWVAVLVPPPTLWLAVGSGVGTILASWLSGNLDKKKLMPEIIEKDRVELAKKDLLEKLTQYIEGKPDP